MELDPRYLRYLHSIARHGTFIRTAEAEGISQPALTNKINQLERQLGVRVLERGRHGARLNRYGELLIRHARAMDAVLERARDEIELEKQGDSGPLSIGGTPISMVDLVPRALSRLVQKDRRVSVSLFEADDEELLNKLMAGEIEIMLGGLISDWQPTDLIEEPLTEFPIRAVIGRSSPFWDNEFVSLTELVDQQWALPAAGSIIRQHVDAIFLSAGEAFPTSYWSCSSMHVLKSVIQHAGCVSLMPVHSIAREADAGVLRGIRLRNPSVARKLSILRLRQLPVSPIAAQFLSALRATANASGPFDDGPSGPGFERVDGS